MTEPLTCSLCNADVTEDDFCEAVGESFCTVCLEWLLEQQPDKKEPAL